MNSFEGKGGGPSTDTPASDASANKNSTHRVSLELAADSSKHGHQGSHSYLVHGFVDAIANDRPPPITAVDAANMLAPGIMAHKSAMKDGEWLDVPDWGGAPE